VGKNSFEEYNRQHKKEDDMSIFGFAENCFTHPGATAGRIQGGFKKIINDSEQFQSTALKVAGFGLGTFFVGKVTDSSLLRTLSPVVGAVTLAYLCWQNGVLTRDHLAGKTDDVAQKAADVAKKASGMLDRFISNIW
jgi:hypothetical protein